MKEYKTVSSRDLNHLTSEVNRLLKEGWKAEGGITVDPQDTPMYLQVLVKESPQSPIKELLLG